MNLRTDNPSRRKSMLLHISPESGSAYEYPVVFRRFGKKRMPLERRSPHYFRIFQYCYSYLFWSESLKYFLGSKGRVISSYTGMIPAHNKMRTTKVLAYQCVKYRLPGSGIAHLKRQYTKQRSFSGIVSIQQDFIG